ncbi:MAG: tetratricopeptide repeat protein [Acidobacteriota bacterium]
MLLSLHRALGFGLGALLLLAASAAFADAAVDADRLFERALTARTAGEPSAAYDLMEQAMQVDPDRMRFASEYRRLVIEDQAYDRSIAFFETLIVAHPDAANARINLGYAFVDKIPDAGAITQVLLANTALGHFTAAIEIDDSWLGRYTRGNSYLYWPPIFGRTQLGMDDLQRAIEIAGDAPRRSYHARAHVALGDGHWRLDDVDAARRVWRAAQEAFPDNPDLKQRLAQPDDAALNAFLEQHFEVGGRVDTDLRAIYEAQ